MMPFSLWLTLPGHPWLAPLRLVSRMFISIKNGVLDEGKPGLSDGWAQLKHHPKKVGIICKNHLNVT